MFEYQTLEDIANKIKTDNKKVTLLYAFNATGKTRLSMKFKELVNGNEVSSDEEESYKKIIYFNAFTEDLFSWDNDLAHDTTRKLKINMNSTFVELIRNQGKENEIADRFKGYTSSKIEPVFNLLDGEVSFNLSTGDENRLENIKISKGEESIFIWSIFYTLIESVIDELNIENELDRSTSIFNQIEYIFIDDPVSSLDDNHAIDVAVDLKNLITTVKYNSPKFIVSTHHALFYNVLYNEISRYKDIKNNNKIFYSLKNVDNKYVLNGQNDSPFGYHLIVKEEIQKAIDSNRIEKYHFALFRNLLEKTATYLGYNSWTDCLVGNSVNVENKAGYIRRINLYSHNKHSNLEFKELIPAEKEMLKILFMDFIQEFKWKGN